MYPRQEAGVTFMRYIIGFLVTIGLLITLIVVLATSGNHADTSVITTGKTLESYATTGSKVQVTIDGPTVANSLHRQVRVTVSESSAVFQSLTGYDGYVDNTKSYTNTRSAYFSFLRALDKAGFTKGDADLKNADYRGYCAQGERFIFEIVDGGKTVQRFWTTSCGTPKTYSGNTNLTLNLFQAQIPDYSALTNGVAL